MMNKQIDVDLAVEEMASAVREITVACSKCGHYADGSCFKPIDLGCDTNEDILNECDALYAKGFRKASDVAFEAMDNFRNAIIDVFIDMCHGNDYNKLTLLQIGDAIDAVYDKQIADFKKKYESEGAE